MAGREQVEGIMGQLEELWRHFDTLYDAVETAGDWGHKHGPDWTFADLPYHMAYFDDQLVARALALGPDYPAAEQERYLTMAEVDAWNAREFAKRPPGQTPRPRSRRAERSATGSAAWPPS